MSSPFFEEMLSSDDPVKSKYTNETLRLTPPDAYSVYFFYLKGRALIRNRAPSNRRKILERNLSFEGTAHSQRLKS